MADPTPEELQDQIDELRDQLTQMRGRFAVLEFAIIRAARKPMPPAFSKWKQEIENKKAEDFTAGMDGTSPTTIEFHHGVVRELVRLKNLLQ